MPLLSLAYLGMYELSPPEFVSCAAAAGFDAVNLSLHSSRPEVPQFPLSAHDPIALETIARLRDTGLIVTDATTIPIDPNHEPNSYKPAFEAAQRLGISRFTIVGGDTEHSRLAHNFARLCEVAGHFEVELHIEFVPYTKIRYINEANNIVSQACQPNSGILIDCLHISRAQTPLNMIGAIDQKHLRYFQLCDAPARSPGHDGLAQEARTNRLPVGYGGLELEKIVQYIPKDADVSVEVPLGGAFGQLPPLERAKLLNETSRTFLRRLGRNF